MMSYEDIINLPRPASRRPKMAVTDRAAQFSSFAALKGHGDAVKETARLTDMRTELDGDEIELLNEKLRLIDAHKDAVVSITYFKPDDRKSGGAYMTVTGTVKKIDTYARRVVMSDKSEIPIGEIREIDSEIFGYIDTVHAYFAGD